MTQNPDLIWQTLDLDHPKTLVDIGAGTGFFAIPFSEKMKGGRVYACDVSEFMVSWMKQNIPKKYRRAVIPLKMAESKVPLSDSIADLVYMIDVYHEFEEPLAVIEEALRLLKPGGKLAVIDWKKEPTPAGPPMQVRVARETIVSHLILMGFADIVTYDTLPYHCLIVACRPPQ